MGGGGASLWDDGHIIKTHFFKMLVKICSLSELNGTRSASLRSGSLREGRAATHARDPLETTGAIWILTNLPTERRTDRQTALKHRKQIN